MVLMTEVPSDPLISGLIFQSGSRKTEKGDPFALLGGDDIPNSIANFRQCPKVMVLLHEFCEQMLFGRLDRTQDNLKQIQNNFPVFMNG